MSFFSAVTENWQWVLLGATGLGIIMIRRHMAGGVCHSKCLMKGKTVIVTGANTGIGKATATELAKREARVILACRDVSKAEKAVQDIRAVTKKGDLVVHQLDLANFKSIRSFVDEIVKKEVKLDVLINNAGIYHCPHWTTDDGLEMQMGVNHFGHFLLTNLLLDKLKSCVPSRVVIVSSGLHQYGTIDFNNLNSEHGYDKAKAYNNSKLANNLFARALSRRLEGSGVSVHCLRPGMVHSDLGRHARVPQFLRWISYPLAWLLVKSTYEGCQTVVYCAVAEELDGVTGQFYGDCKREEWSTMSLDDETADKLWQVSERIVHLHG
jgi:retinol dehydrogenase-14